MQSNSVIHVIDKVPKSEPGFHGLSARTTTLFHVRMQRRSSGCGAGLAFGMDMNFPSLSRRSTVALAIAALLAACQAPPAQTPTPAQPANVQIETTTAPSRPASAVLHGTATYRERIKMPPGADVLVELVDLQAREAVIAKTRLEDVAGPPYRFALSYDPSRLRAGGLYQVQAELIGPDGERWMQGTTAVTPPVRAPVDILLQQVTGPTVTTEGADSDPRDPWRDAQQRGIAYRAVGNEPGWFVEVDSGDQPGLRATLDYGERSVDAPRTVGVSSTRGYRGKTADGVDVLLRIYPETCSDGMSDVTYPTRAELRVGGRAYSGCGRFLRD